MRNVAIVSDILPGIVRGAKDSRRRVDSDKIVSFRCGLCDVAFPSAGQLADHIHTERGGAQAMVDLAHKLAPLMHESPLTQRLFQASVWYEMCDGVLVPSTRGDMVCDLRDVANGTPHFESMLREYLQRNKPQAMGPDDDVFDMFDEYTEPALECINAWTCFGGCSDGAASVLVGHVLQLYDNDPVAFERNGGLDMVLLGQHFKTDTERRQRLRAERRANRM